MAMILLRDLSLVGDTYAGMLLAPFSLQEVDAWPDFVRWLRQAGSFSARGLGARVGVSERVVRGWTAGNEAPGPSARRLLLALAREIVIRDDADARTSSPFVRLTEMRDDDIVTAIRRYDPWGASTVSSCRAGI